MTEKLVAVLNVCFVSTCVCIHVVTEMLVAVLNVCGDEDIDDAGSLSLIDIFLLVLVLVGGKNPSADV